MTRRGDRHRDRLTMKTPVVIVTVALTVAILLAASFLIATGTRGEDADARHDVNPTGVVVQSSPGRK
jgi:hypothetical protein